MAENFEKDLEKGWDTFKKDVEEGAEKVKGAFEHAGSDIKEGYDKEKPKSKRMKRLTRQNAKPKKPR